LTGPAESTPAIFAAVSWIQGTLLGTTATIVATIAVAAVGFMIFTGRIDWRLGARTILGCFILFGASTIAAGILGLAQNSGVDRPPVSETYQSNPPNLAVTPAGPSAGNNSAFDPYAGAAVTTK
jgi:type IV secretory pathway VirB2 component (pilin)